MNNKKFGCILSATVVAVFKFVQFAFNHLAKGISRFFVFTGLIIPACYFLLGVLLAQFFGFDVANGGLERTLYLVGFWLSVLAGLIMLIRNVVVKPVNKAKLKINAKNKKYVPNAPTETNVSVPQPKRFQSIGQNQSYREARAPKYDDESYIPMRSASDKPLVYRSKVYLDIIVYEYSDRFKLYRESGDQLLLVRVQYKDGVED